MDDIQNTPSPKSVQSMMSESLERALGKLSDLETPIPQPKPSIPRVQEERRESVPEQVSETAALEAREPPQASAPQPPTEPKLPEPPAPVQAAWGPQQAKALQEILSANERMEKELATLRGEADKYKGLVGKAQDGDIKGFLAETQLSEQHLREGLDNDGKIPVTRPYVRKLEGTVEQLTQKLTALETRLQEREQFERVSKERDIVSRELQAKPEYGILSKIPDASDRVIGLLRQHEEAARNRGEVSTLTVAQAAALLKGSVVESLRQFIGDEAVRRELGLSPGESQVTPDENVKPSKASKALTGRMTATGSPTKTTHGYDRAEQLQRALKHLP